MQKGKAPNGKPLLDRDLLKEGPGKHFPFAELANVSLDQTAAVEVERAPGRENQEELRKQSPFLIHQLCWL